ncbi:MAG: type II toxin-antitoxin system prevent-host-death family antitoxin [Deltaproteobacteria bacterium]|nr:type II toxin-antitoxin system prevent-host-death family antitoxin [Deltaproteobacteria bacterium]
MKKAAVSELKASLSEYLSKVKKGEEIIVTDRGNPIARLIPFRTQGPYATEREQLAKEGVLELGTGKLSPELLKPSPVEDPQGLLLKALLEEREEGW